MRAVLSRDREPLSSDEWMNNSTAAHVNWEKWDRLRPVHPIPIRGFLFVCLFVFFHSHARRIYSLCWVHSDGDFGWSLRAMFQILNCCLNWITLFLKLFLFSTSVQPLGRCATCQITRWNGINQNARVDRGRAIFTSCFEFHLGGPQSGEINWIRLDIICVYLSVAGQRANKRELQEIRLARSNL